MTRRRHIPLSVKLEVALKALGYTPDEIQWDHAPALALRPMNAGGTDTDPPANSPDHIQILPKAKHLEKTTGRKGESKLSRDGNGDQQRIAKVRRLLEKRVRKKKAENRQRIQSRPFLDTRYRKKLNGKVVAR